jgi:hypothetical protein
MFSGRSYLPDEELMRSTLESQTQWWRLAYWGLFAVWIGCGILVMNRIRIRCGFLTNYGADLTQPAWLYIVVRGLDGYGREIWVVRTFGTRPEKAALVIFVAGALTEVSQRYWPVGLFAGRFDPFDILAFAVGIGVCYLFDKVTSSHSGTASGTR